MSDIKTDIYCSVSQEISKMKEVKQKVNKTILISTHSLVVCRKYVWEIKQTLTI